MEEQGALGGLASTQESSEVPIANLHLLQLPATPIMDIPTSELLSRIG